MEYLLFTLLQGPNLLPKISPHGTPQYVPPHTKRSPRCFREMLIFSPQALPQDTMNFPELEGGSGRVLEKSGGNPWGSFGAVVGKRWGSIGGSSGESSGAARGSAWGALREPGGISRGALGGILRKLQGRSQGSWGKQQNTLSN